MKEGSLRSFSELRFLKYTNSCPCRTGTLRGTDTLSIYIITLFFFHGATILSWPGPPPCRGFTIILRHVPLNRFPLDEWSARQINSYLTTHNTHQRLISMPPAWFEPAIPASKRSQAHSLDRAATAIDFTLAQILILLLIFYSDIATLPLKPCLFLQ
jgi:hypothetical protein